MLRGRKRLQSDEPSGAPEWMVTFSDCMTLLLTFFVLLLSFSSFDEEIFQRLKVFFADALPAVSQPKEQEKDALLVTHRIQPTEDIREGSEKPTLEAGKQDQLKEEAQPVDFRSRKVFLISSEEIYWGRGTAISLQGRELLATIASFLKEVPSRVVISENGAGHPQAALEAGPQSGLPRAWAAMEYLVKKQGLDINRFSISAASTVPQQRAESDEPEMAPKRVLEIVLLERSIYK